uniref:Uncharacterized protein n=1 Tax=Rhizophora mucronata TaxID=61149 RepID=A0A2P2IHK2_RHIMU
MIISRILFSDRSPEDEDIRVEIFSLGSQLEGLGANQGGFSCLKDFPLS